MRVHIPRETLRVLQRLSLYPLSFQPSLARCFGCRLVESLRGLGLDNVPTRRGRVLD